MDDDGSVTPLDALAVINQLNQGSGDTSSQKDKFIDVDDDSQVTPLDALILINELNTIAKPATRSNVLSSPLTGTKVQVETENEGVESEFTVRVDNAPAYGAFPVSVNDIVLGQLMTDDRGRGQLSVGGGDSQHDISKFGDFSMDLELVIGDIVKGKLAKRNR